MKRFIPLDELWKCETCYHYHDGKCSSDVRCENDEIYRPAYSKLTVYTFDEMVVIEDLKLVRDSLVSRMGDHKVLNKSGVIYLFDKLIENFLNKRRES